MLGQDPSSSCTEPPCKYTSVAKDENGQPTVTPWAPFFLRRSTIIAFLCCFLSVLAALIALYVYTERGGRSLGVVTEGNKYYYLWTYGPTAEFTIITAGWAQVEYRAAQLMPWILMRQGPTPSSESVFLDYISPWNIISLYKSLRKKHFLVSLCVSGSLLLHGVTLFSTGIFELNSVPISHQTSLAVPLRFSDAKFDPYIGHETTYAKCSAFATHNMTRPFGLQETFVYTPFYPASLYATGNKSIPASRHYEAEIDLIEILLECHITTTSFETDLTKRAVISNTNTSDLHEGRNATVLTSPDGCRYENPPLPTGKLYSSMQAICLLRCMLQVVKERTLLEGLQTHLTLASASKTGEFGLLSLNRLVLVPLVSDREDRQCLQTSTVALCASPVLMRIEDQSTSGVNLERAPYRWISNEKISWPRRHSPKCQREESWSAHLNHAISIAQIIIF